MPCDKPLPLANVMVGCMLCAAILRASTRTYVVALQHAAACLNLLAVRAPMRTQEVQRLLYVMEAPDYCMRAFRENGVNGQDMLSLQEADMDDSRFKFPKNVQRKV